MPDPQVNDHHLTNMLVVEGGAMAERAITQWPVP
jgi:hypothetical protein